MDDRLLATHADLLERFRRSMNLVGPGPIAPHTADSLAALADLRPAGRWVDLGSGAGFPGIPFAAKYPDVALDLVDSRQKRCVFLDRVLAEGLGERVAPVRVTCARIEDLPAATWDGALARALAPPDEAWALARRVLVPGGTLVLLLQDDQPAPADAVVVHETRYLHEGRPRRSVHVRAR